MLQSAPESFPLIHQQDPVHLFGMSVLRYALIPHSGLSPALRSAHLFLPDRPESRLIFHAITDFFHNKVLLSHVRKNLTAYKGGSCLSSDICPVYTT